MFYLSVTVVLFKFLNYLGSIDYRALPNVFNAFYKFVVFFCTYIVVFLLLYDTIFAYLGTFTYFLLV